MPNFKNLPSKLPAGKTSIFSVMSGLARKHKAIDLSQGFPNFETDTYLKDLVCKAMKDGYNQYPPMSGIPELREQIVSKIENLYGKKYDDVSEIVFTAGATQALYCAITAFVHPGDEVIVFKPAYDSYEPDIKLAGGKPVLVELKGKDFKIDWQEVEAKITSKTRMIIINTPHNPTGTVLSKGDMQRLEALLKNTNIILLSDEVYEHLIYDDEVHESASKFPGLAERAIICASFGKTFHNTGWKMGYCVAPEVLMKEIIKLHQATVFCVNHPMQHAFAEYLKKPEHYLQLGDFYQQKRDKFFDLMQGSGFKGTPSKGTYFQVMDYSKITHEPDVDFARRLITEHGLATIPVSVFHKNGKDHKQLRFCFAKTDETLEKAAEILHKL
ncbi:aminotransferase class I/II-fold pyridoxal phosphate-dependent enzyme [Salegentibacter sp. BLCTC]|uniref:methionine aminotransferase n=1 Tax=Salegentibacter sp. BLCTC TaxID=2697368 RepID=UPI00187B5156|nr:methionine aminotransferase [Salegentibacter sp. BLCTC]MBE7639417.1 aminotransferase class I/II-fold pyridoxal phosphate-dependent enzyme [Salegentibacter sp. BLCTC]